MNYSVGSPLPEYRIRATIDTAGSGNRIQDDEYARRCGFHAGLVSGASVAAYMTRPLVEFAGSDWLARGSSEVRLLRPVYEGEEIRTGGFLSSIGEDGTLGIDCQAVNQQGAVCGAGSARLPTLTGVAGEPSLEDYPAGKARLRRPVSLETLKPGELLTPVTTDFTWNVHWQYCRKSIRDYHPMYEKTLHPGWILSRAGRILSANYAVQAWIDVSCHVQHFNLLEQECAIETRGRVQDKFQSNGDHFVVLDLAVFAPGRCLATLLYTAIFRIAPNAA